MNMIVLDEYITTFEELYKKVVDKWEEIKKLIYELLPEHPESIHPAAKLKQSKQRIHSLVINRKPLMIRARTCC